MTPPAIFVVGEVAALREELSWYENKPLFGTGVVVTRPREQTEEFAELLRAEGARVILFPVITVEPLENTVSLDEAQDRIGEYQWLVFTSANSVRFFFQRLRDRSMDIRDLKGPRIACIGPATAKAVRKKGLNVDIVPDDYISEGVVNAFDGIDLEGAKVLLPRAEKARDVIPEGLAERGASVDVIPLYRTAGSGRNGPELVAMMKKGRVDVLTFTSPSTVKHCLEMIGGVESIPDAVKIACIGPVTAEAAEEAGLRVDIMQGPYDMQGFVSAIVKGMT